MNNPISDESKKMIIAYLIRQEKYARVKNNIIQDVVLDVCDILNGAYKATLGTIIQKSFYGELE
jgi:hypothetical protein